MGRIPTRPTYPVELVDELAMIFVRAAVDRLMSEFENRSENATELAGSHGVKDFPGERSTESPG